MFFGICRLNHPSETKAICGLCHSIFQQARDILRNSRGEILFTKDYPATRKRSKAFFFRAVDLMIEAIIDDTPDARGFTVRNRQLNGTIRFFLEKKLKIPGNTKLGKQ
jgi:hypothetical protein